MSPQLLERAMAMLRRYHDKGFAVDQAAAELAGMGVHAARMTDEDERQFVWWLKLHPYDARFVRFGERALEFTSYEQERGRGDQRRARRGGRGR